MYISQSSLYCESVCSFSFSDDKSSRGKEGFNPQHLSVFKHWDKDINTKPQGSASVTGTEGFNIQHIHMFNPHKKTSKNNNKLPQSALSKGGVQYQTNPSSVTVALQRARQEPSSSYPYTESSAGHEMELSHQAARS